MEGLKCKDSSVEYFNKLAKRGEKNITFFFCNFRIGFRNSFCKQNPNSPVEVGVARNVPDTISPRLEEEFPPDFLWHYKESH